MEMIQTQNQGPLVHSSTYWGSEWETKGFYFLSPASGAFRLLVPKSRKAEVAEARTGVDVVVTIGVVRRVAMAGMVVGREMVEIMFDDRTDDPFTLFLDVGQLELRPAVDDFGKWWEFSIWEDRRGTPHKVLSRRCYLRQGNLPDMSPAPKA